MNEIIEVGNCRKNKSEIFWDGEKYNSLKTDVSKIRAVEVMDAKTYAEGAGVCKAITALEKLAKEATAPLREALDTCRAELTKPLELAKEKQMRAMKEWTRREEETRKREEAEIAEREKKRAEEEALKEAEGLEKAGFKEEAEKVISEPLNVPQVVLQTSVPVGGGMYTRKCYSAKVVDLRLLLQAALAGRVPISYVCGNQKVLDSIARASKESFDCPGVCLVVE